MEAENYLAGGHALRIQTQSQPDLWCDLREYAEVWQPSRLKGIHVQPGFGVPFLAATQVFDHRPVPRKFLSLERTEDASRRFVQDGMILLTCSGSVGRATLALQTHEDMLISHDLLRIQPRQPELWGWLYAFLRSPQARALMSATQYGHIIKHLEVSHLNTLPVPRVGPDVLSRFSTRVRALLSQRNEAQQVLANAEALFTEAVGIPPPTDAGESGYAISARALFGGRRRLEGVHHNPAVRALRAHFASRGLSTMSLAECGFEVWMPSRFKRIPAQDGVELLDSSDLFEINPDPGRRIADGDFGDAWQGRVEPGWLLVARSGQAYGLNGSVAIANASHAGKVVSDDIIRVAPCAGALVRPGYLFVAMSHPVLGRPLVKAEIYGSSIPHLDVGDLARLRIVRLNDQERESEIAELAERGVRLLSDADTLEREIAAEAGALVDGYVGGGVIARTSP